MTYNDATIDRIYEAALVPEQWNTVLKDLADIAGCVGGIAFSARDRIPGRILFTDTLFDFQQRATREGWWDRNTRAERLLQLPAIKFHSDADYISEEEMKKDPFYSNFLWSMDLGYAAATHVPLPSGDSLVISLERCRKDGPVPTEVVQLLTSLRPHIARSAHLSARYSFERVLSANRAFALTGLPSAAVSIQGKVIDSNEPFNQRFAASLSTSERLRLCGPETNRALDDCLAALHAGAEGGPMARRSIALPRTDTTESAVLHLVPAAGFARDVFACAALFVILTPLDATRLAPVELIQGLFDLTTMEARVARALATGSDIGSTAEGFGISRETVRAHLKSIFAKTGFTRQTDLATAISLVRTIE